VEEAWGDAGVTRLTRLQNRFWDTVRSGKATEAAKQPGTARDLSALQGHKYALLVTFKRDGTPMPTPVWFGLAGDKLFVRTESDTAKVKRIRNDPHVRVGPCSERGKPKGPLTEGRARVVSPEDEEQAEAAIAANYGKGRQFMDRFEERMNLDLVYIEVTPEGGEA
jgi:PPOX class probable F420-dependent enzyme